MNKQELIKHFEDLPYVSITQMGKKSFIDLIKQLDEQEIVKIPQFVAEHIEWAKKEDFHLLGAMNRENFDKKLEDWFYTDDNMELFARAWLDGYEEAEEEKRYYVRLKNVDENYNYLNRINHLDAWCLTEIKTDKKFRTTHTRKQLEDAGFGEVFNSPLFEVEEVE
jgi:hypothetical protein|nr:MAG TPA: Protein of unknown function (DUF1642) [Caudoviricetes sp.]